MSDQNTLDPLEMSDEDFLKMDPSEFAQADEDDNGATSTDDDSHDDLDDKSAGNADNNNSSDDEEDDDGSDDSDSDSDDDSSDNDESGSADEQGDADESSDGDSDDDAADSDKADQTVGLTDAQLADIGRQVMGEFKANGRTMKVKSAEDAIQLMQMGANYHKKMSGMKPAMKTLKLLENHDLLDPAKLNYLIDLSMKKPEAIKKLLKESNLDPMDIDLDDANDYVPSNRSVNDSEIMLDEVLDNIKETPSYNRTLTVIGEEWDAPSRGIVAQNPEIIKTINLHMENGIYDQVANAVAYERSLGKLVGVSDFEAYQQVGQYMDENKMFTRPAAQNQQGQHHNNQNHQQSRQDSEQNREEEAARKNRKKSVSNSRQKKAPVKDDQNYNPLEMSDEEFLKINKLSL